MPIRYTIDHEARFVHARAEGPTSLQDVEALLDAIVVQDALSYRKLFDASDAIAEYKEHDIMTLGARASVYAKLARRGALAIVPRKNVHPELALRFLNLARYEGAARIFQSADDGLKWLESLPEDES
mgnify:FL=1